MSVHKKLVKVSASSVQDSPELQDLLKKAVAARSPEFASSFVMQPLSPVVNPFLLNPRISKNLKDLGVGEASQSVGQSALGSLGTLAGGLAGGGIGLGLGGSIDLALRKNPADLLGLADDLPFHTVPGEMGGSIGALGGLIGGLLLSELNRDRRLKKRVREAYAANQLAG